MLNVFNPACYSLHNRIRGKEDMVGEYEEEAEEFKDKNYQQKDRVRIAFCDIVCHGDVLYFL